MLIAGSAVGVQASNAETTQRSAGAVTAAQSADAAVTTSVDKAAKALDVAKAAKGYDKADGAATLLTGVDKAKQDLGTSGIGTECTTRDQAAALVSSTEAVTAKVATLDEAAVKLSAHVGVFQTTETKRIAAQKKAADEKAAADKAAADKAKADADAKKKADDDADAAAAQVAAAVQAPSIPRYAAPAPAGGGGYVPRRLYARLPRLTCLYSLLRRQLRLPPLFPHRPPVADGLPRPRAPALEVAARRLAAPSSAPSSLRTTGETD